MFTKNCFIQKCNKTLINNLIELDYKPIGNINYNTYGIYCHNGKFKTCSTNEQPSIRNKNFIQCYDNEELFLALAALRDDSDYMQWFVCPKTRMRIIPGFFGQVIGMDGHYREIVGYEWYRYENKDNLLTERINKMSQMEGEEVELLPHKATVEELIEHFNIKK